MIVLGCYWKSSSRELFLEVFDKKNLLFMNISGHLNKFSTDKIPKMSDKNLVKRELKRIFDVCKSTGSPVEKINYKGPYKNIVQGQIPFSSSSSIQSMSPFSAMILETIEDFSDFTLGKTVAKKKANIPNNPVLKSANQLINVYCNDSLERGRKMAIYAAISLGNSKKQFVMLTKRMVKLQLKRNYQYSTAKYVEEVAKVLTKLA